jgi:hypothetical protein
MTDQERIQALVDLGYTEREAAFLAIAALHSGYFLRRQFLYFAGIERGEIAQAFIDRAILKQHCKPKPFRHDRIVYHLASKPLFEVLGSIDNRNRRNHDVTTMKCRLMALDYILQRLHDHPHDRFFPTESDKLSFFVEELRLAPDCLPIKKYRSSTNKAFTERWFVDKFPVYVPAEDPACVCFCYIDPGNTTLTAFENHVAKYRPLWLRMADLNVIYIGATKFNMSRAHTAFDRLISRRESESDDALTAKLISHFRMRAAFEGGDRIGFTQQKLIELRRDLRLYSRFETLYQQWVQDQNDAMLHSQDESSSRSKTPRRVTFSTYELRFNYELFGNRLALEREAGTPCIR